METVARVAGVSTATLYAHFPSKAKLFEMVAHDALGRMAEPVRASVETKGDARARLTSLALAYAGSWPAPRPGRCSGWWPANAPASGP